MGGGGGDNGYEARQQQIEGNKAKARAALNAVFGIGSSAPEDIVSVLGPAPDKGAFTTTPKQWTTVGGSFEDFDRTNAPSVFDQAGYDQAMADYNAKVGERKTALSNNAQSRDNLYQQVRDSAFTAGKRSLDENYKDAARKNKFELFARGLAGGSEDIDQNARLKRTYDSGIMDLGAKADSAKANFRNQDEQTRLQLLESINNGTDQGSALSAATNRMAADADRATADAQGLALGNVFDTAGLLYSNSQAARGRADAQNAFNTLPTGASNPKARGSGATGNLYKGPGV